MEPCYEGTIIMPMPVQSAHGEESAGERLTLALVFASLLSVALCGVALLAWWTVICHPSNKQLWAVPVGLVMAGTPAVVCFSLSASGACRKLDGHTVLRCPDFLKASENQMSPMNDGLPFLAPTTCSYSIYSGEGQGNHVLQELESDFSKCSAI